MTYKIQEINFCNFNLETSLQKKLSENQIIMAEESPPPLVSMYMYLEYCYVYLETVFTT